MLRRTALSGWGAWARGDFGLMLVRFAPDYHFEPPREWLAAGMRSVYRGHAGLREWSADLREAWEFLDHTPLEIVDAGYLLAFLCQIRLRARVSGIELDTRLGQVFWIERGLIVRESGFADWDEPLRAAGIPTAAVGRLVRRHPCKGGKAEHLTPPHGEAAPACRCASVPLGCDQFEPEACSDSPTASRASA